MKAEDFISKADELITTINEQQVLIAELMEELEQIKLALHQETH